MTELTNFPNTRLHPGASPAVRAPNPGPLPTGHQEFSTALGQGGELDEIQSSETRQAIRQSLDRLHQNPARARPETPSAGPGTAPAGPGTTPAGPGTTPSDEGKDAGPGTAPAGPGTVSAGPGTVSAGPGTTPSDEGKDAGPGTAPTDEGKYGATETPPPRPRPGPIMERPPELAPPTPARPTLVGTPVSTDPSAPVQAPPPGPVPAPEAPRTTPSGPEIPVRDAPRDPGRLAADRTTTRQTPTLATLAATEPDDPVQDESRGPAPLPAGESTGFTPMQMPSTGRASLPGTPQPAQTPADAGFPAARPENPRPQSLGTPPPTENSGTRAPAPQETRHAAPGIVSDGHNHAADLSSPAKPAGTADPMQMSGVATQRSSASQATRLTGQLSYVADRILVSLPDSANGDEVRIQLRPSLLDGSGIRIFREGGELNIVFTAPTETAQRFLADNQARFQGMLGDRLPDDRVRIEVEATTRRDSASGDNEGRSRQRYHPQPDEPGAE